MTDTLQPAKPATQSLADEVKSAPPPSNTTFAEEVKAERLVALYRVTMAISVFARLGFS